VTPLDEKNIIVVLLLMLFTFPVFISTSAAVYATFNSTNSTSIGQLNQDLTVTSKGCGEGYGYYADDPNPICEPLDKIGHGPPPDMAFCAALGCPYNPPAETELPSDNENNKLATTPVTPTERTAAEEAEEEPTTEPDPGNEDQNEEQDTQNNEEESSGNSDGGDGGSDDSEE
jgi:hypothetical protein